MQTRQFYNVDKVVTLLHEQRSLSLLQVKVAPLATISGKTGALIASDVKHTSLAYLHGRMLESYRYLPYGYSVQADVHPVHPAYNGEWRLKVTGNYPLGSGHRVYNPKLMRFESSDSASPFGQGGINAYVYCQGDPLNYADPSGRFRIGRLKLSCCFRWPFSKRVRFSDKYVKQAVASVTKALLPGEDAQKASLRKLSDDRRAVEELSTEVLELNMLAAGISWRGSNYDHIIQRINLDAFRWYQEKLSFSEQVPMLVEQKAFLTAFVGVGPDQDLIPLANAVRARWIRSEGQTPPAWHPR